MLIIRKNYSLTGIVITTVAMHTMRANVHTLARKIIKIVINSYLIYICMRTGLRRYKHVCTRSNM